MLKANELSKFLDEMGMADWDVVYVYLINVDGKKGRALFKSSEAIKMSNIEIDDLVNKIIIDKEMMED